MNTGASISETRSQRKDIIGPYTLSFCINCRLQTSSNSDSLEHNMCTREHGANGEGLLHACALRSAPQNRMPERAKYAQSTTARSGARERLWPAMAVLVPIGLSFISIS